MQCQIYKSLRKLDYYLYLADVLESVELPDSLPQLLGDLDWVMELDLQPDTRLASVDAGTVLSALQERKFYLQMPSTDKPHPFDM